MSFKPAMMPTSFDVIELFDSQKEFESFCNRLKTSSTLFCEASGLRASVETILSVTLDLNRMI